jgi:hypothetical protein
VVKKENVVSKVFKALKEKAVLKVRRVNQEITVMMV